MSPESFINYIVIKNTKNQFSFHKNSNQARGDILKHRVTMEKVDIFEGFSFWT